MTLTEMEDQKYNIPLKDFRQKQLELLSDGITPGIYTVSVTHFDGRPITKVHPESFKEWRAIYHHYKCVYDQCASVNALIEFDLI